MRKSRAIVVCVLAAIIVGAVVISASHRHDPVYQKKRLSEWIAQLDSEGRKRAQAVKALREIGTNAVPYVMQSLGPGDSPRKMKLIQLARKQTVVKAPFRLAYERQSTVLKAFYYLGADAKGAIPALNKLLDNPLTIHTAIYALFGIGNEAMPALTEACNHTNRDVRHQAALVLALLKRGRDFDSMGRTPIPDMQFPSFVLGFTEEDILSVTGGLYDSQPAVRRASAEALEVHSDFAKSTVPKLVKLLTDPDKAVQEAAVKALKKIDPDAAAKVGVK
jgi:HEAT repeat protein